MYKFKKEEYRFTLHPNSEKTTPDILAIDRLKDVLSYKKAKMTYIDKVTGRLFQNNVS
jgi:hypothetical protein